jgi:hypothetical protein
MRPGGIDANATLGTPERRACAGRPGAAMLIIAARREALGRMRVRQ